MITIRQAQIGYINSLVAIERLELSSGRIYVLVGRNGSGKSTLLRTLIGQQKLLAGDLHINGHSVKDIQENSALRARQIAFVSSMFTGVEALTLNAYVALGRVPHLGPFGRMQAEDWQLVDQTLHDLQIAHLATKATKQLSDGEKQLASLARAIVQDTPVLILDEPTSFLDFFNRALLLDQLQKWVEKRPDRTVVLSSHDLEPCFEKQISMLVLANKQLELIEKPDKKKVLTLFGTDGLSV
jgi:iron complex transport system ATP-binding protein